MSRRYVRRRGLDDLAEQESAPVAASTPVVENEPGDAMLTELLITGGPERLGGATVAATSVARLQRLAGNRAVADRLGGGVATVQRKRNRTSDEEEALPEPAQAGPIETAEPAPEQAPEPAVAPPAQAGPTESAPEPAPEAAPNAATAAQAGIEKAAEKPEHAKERPTGLDRVVDEKVAPIVDDADRLLPVAEIEPKAPGPGTPEDQVRASEPDRVLPVAEVEPKAPLPVTPDDQSRAPAQEATPAEAAPVPAAPAAPVVEAPSAAMPEAPTPDQTAPTAEEAPSPAVAPPDAESLPSGDQAQIAIMTAVGAQAVAEAATATRNAEGLAAGALATAGVGFASVIRQTMSRAARVRNTILRIAPKIAGAVGRMLTGLRTTASTMIKNVATKVKSVADAAKGVVAWARETLGAARGAARGVADRIRSALGGVGDAIAAFLSSLLAPAREALARLRRAAAEVLLEGIKQVRAAAAKAVAFVKEEVVSVLDAALAAAVNLVRDLVKAARERARRAKAADNRRFAAIRAELGVRRAVARGMLAAARTTLSTGFINGTRLIATATSNGSGRLATRLGRRTFFQRAKMSRKAVRELRRRGKTRISESTTNVKLFDTAAKTAIATARAEARANHAAARTSLEGIETTATTEAEELRKSAAEAAATATGAVDAAVTEGEALIKEIAGEGDRDAGELQTLVGRAGR